MKCGNDASNMWRGFGGSETHVSGERTQSARSTSQPQHGGLQWVLRSVVGCRDWGPQQR